MVTEGEYLSDSACEETYKLTRNNIFIVVILLKEFHNLR